MLDAIRFVIGAVARKDFVEQLCHLFIEDGRATAFDGLLTASTPIDVVLKVRPHARTFANAVKACDEDAPIVLHVTPAGRLSVRQAAFRALVKCIEIDDGVSQPSPEGEHVDVTPELLGSLIALAPLMATDASRPWARGLRIVGNSTYATNNVILAERWHGANFPREIIIPADCVHELIRIKEPPTSCQVSETSITFHYPDGRWLRSQLVLGEWPDGIDRVFNSETTPVTISDEFFPALTKLKKFADERNRVFIKPGSVTTMLEEEADGASIDVETDGDGACFSLDMLMLLDGVATSIGFAAYPNPCPFRGKLMRGVILGQRY